MASGTTGRMPLPTSEARPSLTSVFSKTPTSVLTHEEECMLKTALAVVVVKQRRKSQFQQAKNDQKKARVPTSGQEQGLLDHLFAQNVPPNRSSLLLLSHRQHLDRIFQAALNMSSHNNNNNSTPNLSLPKDPRLDIFHGTCSHLASQLQTWLQEDGEENGNAAMPKEDAEGEIHKDDNRPPNEKGSSSTKGEFTKWIRQSLMTTPCWATFQVYYQVLQFGNSQLNAFILNTLLKLLLEAYHDRLVVPPHHHSGAKQHHTSKLKAPPTYSINGSNSNPSTPLDGKHNSSIDWFTVSWLRLTHRCVKFLSAADLHSILNHNASNLAHLLLPLESPSSLSKNYKTPSLIQTFWEMSSTVPSAAGIPPLRTSKALLTPPARLGTGAKMLLRLGLYRLLYCNISSGQDLSSDGLFVEH